MTILLELVEQSREEWLAGRTRGIGASESAGILGASPWSSPLSVWVAKTSDDAALEVVENEAMRWGTLLEPVVLEEYARRRGVCVERHDQAVSLDHPRFSENHMTATPDAYSADGGLVEIKTTSAYMAADWEDGAPLHYRIQLQHQMAVAERDHGTLVALIGGQRLVWHDEERKPEFVAALETACAQFWSQFVEPRIMPPASALAGDIRILERLHPEDSGETITLSAESAEWTARLEEIQEALRPLEKEKAELQGQIKAALGLATFGEVPGLPGRWSWKHQDRKAYQVEASVIRVLRRLKK